MPTADEFLQLLAEDETTGIDYLIATGSTLSNECAAFTFIDTAKVKLVNFTDKASAFFNGLKIGNYSAKPVYAEPMLKHIQEVGYGKIRGELISIPAGFVGNLSDLVNLIESTLPDLEYLEPSLKITLSRLAQLLNESDRFKAQSGIRDLESKIKLIDTSTYDALRSFFKPHQKAQARLSDVFDRIADIGHTYTIAQQINDRLAKIDFTSINALSDRLGDLSKECSTVLANGQQRETSGTVASQLADVIYRLGVSVTVAAMVIQIMTELTEVLRQNVDSLNNA